MQTEKCKVDTRHICRQCRVPGPDAYSENISTLRVVAQHRHGGEAHDMSGYT